MKTRISPYDDKAPSPDYPLELISVRRHSDSELLSVTHITSPGYSEHFKFYRFPEFDRCYEEAVSMRVGVPMRREILLVVEAEVTLRADIRSVAYDFAGYLSVVHRTKQHKASAPPLRILCCCS